jgi:hypothetical protein
MGSRSLDRRFWLRFDIAMGCLGVLLVVLAESLLVRTAYVVYTAYWIADAVHKSRRIKRDGRWMDPPDQHGRAHLRPWRLAMMVLIFVVGLLIGLN